MGPTDSLRRNLQREMDACSGLHQQVEAARVSSTRSVRRAPFNVAVRSSPALSHRIYVVTDFRLGDIKYADSHALQAVQPQVIGMTCVIPWRDSQVQARWQRSLEKLAVAVRSQVHHATIRRIN